MRLKIITLIALLIGVVHWSILNWPISHRDGILVPDPPIQIDISDPKPFLHDDFIITPLAEYEITARVLSTRRYRVDASSALSPVDFALGWQQMSDSAILRQLKIRQSGRFYSFRPKKRNAFFPLPVERHLLQSANSHIIPADTSIARRVKRVKKGQIITLEGYLVSVYRSKDRFTWKSSLTRSDSGGGACELIWVTDIQVH
jgi:hypothetical protein